MKRKYDHLHQEIADLYRNGNGYKAIARCLGIDNHGQVRRELVRIGLVRKTKNDEREFGGAFRAFLRRKKKESEIVRLRKAGKSRRRIVFSGFSEELVDKCLNVWGLRTLPDELDVRQDEIFSHYEKHESINRLKGELKLKSSLKKISKYLRTNGKQITPRNYPDWKRAEIIIKQYYARQRKHASKLDKLWLRHPVALNWDALRYYHSPKGKLASRNYRSKPENILKHRLRCRLAKLVCAKPSKSNTRSSLKLCGCGLSKLKSHIESTFSKGMTWENYGEWHIDHMIPCSAFDLTKLAHVAMCFHFSNLQALWGSDNLKKHAKLDSMTKFGLSLVLPKIEGLSVEETHEYIS